MYLLAIDQGTSSTKAILFNSEGKVVKRAVADLRTEYFPDGRVEQNPMHIISSVETACRQLLEDIDATRITSIGISNQRETFVLWDGDGKPVYPAVVWACKRSTSLCEKLRDQNDWLRKKTGLLMDPYFSASKLLWIMENEPEIASKITQGDIFFGTVDTWLLYQLTNGEQFLTDHTNASRTLLFNIHELQWDSEILETWQLDALKFPEIKSSSHTYGSTDVFGLIPNKVPITAMIGDSHAAMFGEACFKKGDTKMTLGTGCSLLMHLGDTPLPSKNGLLTTIGWSVGNTVAYAWEGAIVSCGSMIEWLKGLNIIANVEETEEMARKVAHDCEVLLIPAFSGLGAPFWQMDRKASFHGITFGTKNEHLVAATLDAICFQIKAVIDAMEGDLGHAVPQLAMHGGLSKNKYIRQTLEHLLHVHITLQDNSDISAQGAAYLAGLTDGTFRDLEHISELRTTIPLDTSEAVTSLNTRYNSWLARVKQHQ